jgi:hypothetical protein
MPTYKTRCTQQLTATDAIRAPMIALRWHCVVRDGRWVVGFGRWSSRVGGIRLWHVRSSSVVCGQLGGPAVLARLNAAMVTPALPPEKLIKELVTMIPHPLL